MHFCVEHINSDNIDSWSHLWDRLGCNIIKVRNIENKLNKSVAIITSTWVGKQVQQRNQFVQHSKVWRNMALWKLNKFRGWGEDIAELTQFLFSHRQITYQILTLLKYPNRLRVSVYAHTRTAWTKCQIPNVKNNCQPSIKKFNEKRIAPCPP